MIFNSKKINQKFAREIKALGSLNNSKDALRQEELAEVKQRVLELISKQAGADSYSLTEKAHNIIRYAVSALVGLSLIGGTAFASGGSIPGDLLYPVKIAAEKVQLGLATSDESKVNLQAKFAQVRLDELKALSQKIKLDAGENNADNNHQTSLGATTDANGKIEIHNTSTNINAAGTVLQHLNKDNRHGKPKDRQLQDRAQAEATLEVNNAISNLERIHKKFKDNGNSQAAASIQANILNLQSRAQAENVIGDGSGDNRGADNQGRGRGEDGINIQASSSPGSQIPGGNKDAGLRLNVKGLFGGEEDDGN